MITFGYRNRTEGWIRSIVAIILGLLMLFAKASIGNSIIYIVGLLLVVVAGIQLVVFGSVRTRAGLGAPSLMTTVILIGCALLLFFNPFSINIMRIIAGISLIMHGINEISALPRVSKAITDNYGPMGEDKGVDEQ